MAWVQTRRPPSAGYFLSVHIISLSTKWSDNTSGLLIVAPGMVCQVKELRVYPERPGQAMIKWHPGRPIPGDVSQVYLPYLSRNRTRVKEERSRKCFSQFSVTVANTWNNKHIKRKDLLGRHQSLVPWLRCFYTCSGAAHYCQSTLQTVPNKWAKERDKREADHGPPVLFKSTPPMA